MQITFSKTNLDAGRYQITFHAESGEADEVAAIFGNWQQRVIESKKMRVFSDDLRGAFCGTLEDGGTCLNIIFESNSADFVFERHVHDSIEQLRCVLV